MAVKYVSEKDIQKPRSAPELSKFVDEVIHKISLDPEERKKARSGKGLYKLFMEELLPISWYFCDENWESNRKLQLKTRNEGHDAVVLDENGTFVEWIEVSWPIDGQKEAMTVQMLNERRFSRIEIYESPLAELQKVFELTVKGAKKKALRDYRQKEKSTLLLIVDLLPYFQPNERSHNRAISGLADTINQIEFRVDQVTLVLSYSTDVTFCPIDGSANQSVNADRLFRWRSKAGRLR